VLKVCKRLYNYVKTGSWWTEKWIKCIEKLSNLFKNPILSWVSLVDWLEIWIKWWQNLQNTISSLREYGKNYLSLNERSILEKNLIQIEKWKSIDTSIKEIKSLITSKIESTVQSYIESSENWIIKEYLDPILWDITYNSKNNK
jgi:hypothetical protein